MAAPPDCGINVRRYGTNLCNLDFFDKKSAVSIGVGKAEFLPEERDYFIKIDEMSFV